MSQLTISISDKADALIAQLQKEIFNRRRKKVTAQGVVETLLESGAKSQSDRRFATSWQNLLADIEKAAKVAQTHGSKPSALSDEEWALVLSHRTRATMAPESPRPSRPRAATKAKTATTTPARRRATASAAKALAAEELLDGPISAPTTRATRAAKPRTASRGKTSAATGVKPKASATRGTGSRKRSTASSASASSPAKPPSRSQSRKASPSASKSSRSSVARRMAKAASRLVSSPPPSIPTSTMAAPAPTVNGSNGVDSSMATTPLS